MRMSWMSTMALGVVALLGCGFATRLHSRTLRKFPDVERLYASRDAERARTELDTLSQVISANLTRAALEAAPVIADLSSWLADVAGKAGIAWERLFDAPEEKSLRTLRYELRSSRKNSWPVGCPGEKPRGPEFLQHDQNIRAGLFLYP